jgi:predicted nucleic acid-binding protein
LSAEDIIQSYLSQTCVIPDSAINNWEFQPDPRDAHVIAAARAIPADWLITGDAHLLDAKDIIPCEVHSVAEAYERASLLVDQPR